jgi:hypothetical protein
MLIASPETALEQYVGNFAPGTGPHNLRNAELECSWSAELPSSNQDNSNHMILTFLAIKHSQVATKTKAHKLHPTTNPHRVLPARYENLLSTMTLKIFTQTRR